MNERIPVVTGLGVVAPNGVGTASFWASVLEGRTGVAPVRGFDTSAFDVHIGAEVKGLEPQAPSGSSVGRAAILAAAAGREALAAAGLDDATDSMGLCLGTTMGEARWLESWPPAIVAAGPDAVPAQELTRSGPDQLALDTARLLGIGGSTQALGAACAAGNYALARATDLVRLGRTDAVLAGGAEGFSRVAFTGFHRLGALAREACRPFDRHRDGLVLGEGAGMLVVEALGAARARGARPLAVVAGSGLSSDAHHIVSPDPQGGGALRSMEAAVAEASLSPDDLDWVCAHGTGTIANDRAEVVAARKLFSHPVPMSSIKGLTGHGMGAASAIEAVACVLALRDQVMPPSWNLSEMDPECEWDLVPGAPRRGELRAVLNNGYAFGGTNASVVLMHPEAR